MKLYLLCLFLSFDDLRGPTDMMHELVHANKKMSFFSNFNLAATMPRLTMCNAR